MSKAKIVEVAVWGTGAFEGVVSLMRSNGPTRKYSITRARYYQVVSAILNSPDFFIRPFWAGFGWVAERREGL